MEKIYRLGLYLILTDLGIVWLRSSVGKITGGKFAESLGVTLTKFASQNPNLWYKDLLQSTAIPNAKILGNIIMWGEFLVAIAITFSSLYLLFNKDKRLAHEILLLGLLGGIILNLNFWLASGWTSPSTESLNLLMLTVEAVALIICGKILFKK